MVLCQPFTNLNGTIFRVYQHPLQGPPTLVLFFVVPLFDSPCQKNRERQKENAISACQPRLGSSVVFAAFWGRVTRDSACLDMVPRFGVSRFHPVQAVLKYVCTHVGLFFRSWCPFLGGACRGHQGTRSPNFRHVPTQHRGLK